MYDQSFVQQQTRDTLTKPRIGTGRRPPKSPGPLEEAAEDDLEVIGPRPNAGGSGGNRAHDDNDDDGEREGWTRRVASLFPDDQRASVEQRLHGMAAKVPVLSDPCFGRLLA